MEAVKNGTPIQRAARLHGVPRTTLRDRTSGRVKHGKKPGSTPYPSIVEEKELASFITDVAKAGYGKSRQEIKRITEDVASDKGVLKKRKISDGWYRRFIGRQPELSLRRGDATANVRTDRDNEEIH